MVGDLLCYCNCLVAADLALGWSMPMAVPWWLVHGWSNCSHKINAVAADIVRGRTTVTLSQIKHKESSLLLLWVPVISGSPWPGPLVTCLIAACFMAPLLPPSLPSDLSVLGVLELTMSAILELQLMFDSVDCNRTLQVQQQV